MSTTHLFFRIVYNAIYVLLCLVTATLLLVVPGDIATQAIFLSHSWINVIILGIVIALALLIILFVYVTRLYITRMALAAIPRAWIPIEKSDVAKHVRELILQDLCCSHTTPCTSSCPCSAMATAPSPSRSSSSSTSMRSSMGRRCCRPTPTRGRRRVSGPNSLTKR